VPLEGPYLNSGGYGVGRRIWGLGPPKGNFFIFFCGTSPRAGGGICRMEIIVTGDAFDV